MFEYFTNNIKPHHNLHIVNIFTDFKIVLSKFNLFIAQLIEIYFTLMLMFQIYKK